jgi:uncharacterized protein YuzE
MMLTYDLGHDLAYVRLGTPGAHVETVRVSDDVHVDVAPDGTVYGIELLHATALLRGGDGGLLVVVDEARGERRSLPLE